MPLRRKGRVIGALNLLSDTAGQFTDDRRGAAAPVRRARRGRDRERAAVRARARSTPSTLETLAEIGREFGVDPRPRRAADAHRAASTRRVIDYRTFGILLLNEETRRARDEARRAVRRQGARCRACKLGDGLVGYAALHKEPVLVPDVSQDPRYIKVVDDVRSELVIPLLLKDRCIGVFDLESPELDAFSKRDVEILTLLASQAAVAIENARLYETMRANEVRLEKELRFAQRVQAALLPTELPKRLKGVDVGGAVRAGARARRRLPRLPRRPKPNTLVVAVGDVSGKGVPAALYSAFAGELVRVAHVPPPLPAGALSAGGRAGVDEHDPARAPARGVLLHALLRALRSQAPHRDARQLRPAVSDPLQRRTACAQIELPGVPLGSFPGIDLRRGDVRAARGRRVRVLHRRRVRGDERERARSSARRGCSTSSSRSRELAAARDRRRDLRRRSRSSAAGAPPNDDMTAVAVKITT